MEQTACRCATSARSAPAPASAAPGCTGTARPGASCPTDFKIRSETESRYGKNFIPAGMTIQDWGVTYDELEPYYDRFEYLCGVCGQAGNVQGEIQAGGNPFEGAALARLSASRRSSAAPARCCSTRRRETSASSRSPARRPTRRRPYTNPLGVQMGAVHLLRLLRVVRLRELLEGDRRRRTILPVLLKKDNFAYRTRCDVTAVNLDASGKRATGVTYVDGQGREFEQPAELVILCAFAQHNVHLHAALGHRQALRPAGQHGRGRPQLRLPDHVVGRRLRRRAHQSVHGRRRARPGGRRIQRRQLRPRPAGFIGGGYIAPVDDRRPADPADTTCPRARRSGARAGRRRWRRTI